MRRRDAETQSTTKTFQTYKARVRKQQFSFLSVSASLRLILLGVGLGVIGCSVPNLEKPECTAGRGVVKRFYSFHFGNEMNPSVENLKAREHFLTAELVKGLSASSDQKKDYFTATEDYPRTFRVGECTVDSADKATLQVVLLWRDDTRTEQKEVYAEAVNIGGKWLINKVFN